jgi:predicted negative regulator of RcsB-dependent stress response
MEMETAMREFIEQPDYPTMIINTSDNDVLYPSKVLQNFERQTVSEIYMIFPFECKNVNDYMQQCMELLKAQIKAVNDARIEDKLEPWPKLPLFCSDTRQVPFARLRLALDYVRNVLPDDIPAVWGLMPPSIDDVAGYKALIAPLMALNGYQDWMSGHRFFVRDNKQTPFILPELERSKNDTVLVIDIDFSPERASDNLVQTVNDENATLPDRMQALFQLAALDFAHQRYEQAVEKYDCLHAYSMQQGDSAGQALALSGVGDIALRLGENEIAKQRYQQALALAVPAENLQVMLNIFMSVGEACMRLQHYDDAEGYLSFASQTAGKLLNPFVKIEAMEKLGEVYLNMGKHAEAIKVWKNAAELCKQFEQKESLVTILDRLATLNRNLGLTVEAHKYEMEKEAVD